MKHATNKINPESPLAKASQETLTHFQCPKCLGWWTVGDSPKREYWFCTWCGTKLGAEFNQGDDKEWERNVHVSATSSGQGVEVAFIAQKDEVTNALVAGDIDSVDPKIVMLSDDDIVKMLKVRFQLKSLTFGMLEIWANRKVKK